MKTTKIIFKLLVISVLLYITGCAQQGSPTGGPKDTDPPKVLKSDPPNYSTEFNGQRIAVEFDEFLDMANFTQELIVSPPMEEKPEVKLRNKTLVIDFQEELKEDATYTFNFGDGIKDLNERNVLSNYEFVFSTGTELDSLSVKGTIKNAFDLSLPEDPIMIMLYNQLNDSVPLQEIPYYVGRSDKEGNFAINNLRKGIYKLFVLKDGNNNFLYDLPSEKIAFLDTSLLVDGNYFRKLLLEKGVYDSTDFAPDTTAMTIDTTGMSPDSIQIVLDSLDQLKPDLNSIYVDLLLFTEDELNRYISEYKRKNKESLNILFSLPPTDSFSFSPVFPDTLLRDDFIPEFGLKGDSLVIWAADTNVASLDTIGISLVYTGLDSLENYVSIRDTLQFTYRAQTESTRKDKSKEPENKSIDVKTITAGGKLDIYKDLSFTIAQPVKSIDLSKFELFVIPDSIENRLEIVPFIDTNHLRRVKIKHSWDEAANFYRLVLYPGAIYDIYGGTNDTIRRKFNIKRQSEYGKVILTLEEVEDTIILQLITKDQIIRETVIYSSGTYEFDYINPATYKVKFIHDSNGNGKWDSGDYLQGKQPEKVEFLPKEFKVRANWDHNFSHIMGTNNQPPRPDEPVKTEEEDADDLDNINY